MIDTPPLGPLPGTALPSYVFEAHEQLDRHVAGMIATIIRDRAAKGQRAVLGLPTGSTPVGIYRELGRMHRDEGLDFANVVTFNLDEYLGLGEDRLQSYRRWMHEHLFKLVNVPPENIFIPDGLTPPEKLEEHCRWYEERIREHGGIDIQLLGIGRNGHIGFNEPFSARDCRTRVCTLDPLTRRDAASDFFSEENVPVQAITMGLGTILDARKIVLIALGEHKAGIIRETVEGPATPRVPACYLREHGDAALMLDSAAAGKLTAMTTPWVLGKVKWTDALVKRAVLWLSEQSGKALLKLDDDDFRHHNLHQLLRHYGPAQELAHRVFRQMMDTIDYHPAGRESQRVICFSPHPDDDVISMGGTLIRLVEDGHEAHVAYMTSGNIAVFDHDAQRVADLVAEFNRLFNIDDRKSRELEHRVAKALADKAPGESDSPEVLTIKSLIRWSEAKAGAIVAGCREENLHFLDMPFYRTGTISKKPITDEDVAIVRALIEQVQPAQIYVAGDLSDPHGTHRVCADAIFRAVIALESDTGSRPEVLLYRGAWQEWAPHEIEIAVPLSPRDLRLKRQAIFMHESQKDSALFPGPDDPREFWQRAEDRNRNTAAVYNQFGLPEYFAMEGFVRWSGRPL
ncbi:MAG: glucosamine-6-phosphate deaminase [Planctomycetota bacterium]|nr:MAG: glucosamine-6-phosphate deaminase [Planctomycetota bacterium]